MRLGFLLMVAVLAGLAVGCSGSSSASQTSRAELSQERLSDATGLIYQCALTRGLMGPPDFAALEPLPHGVPRWVQGSKVVITNSNGAYFDSWITGQAGILIRGQKLDYWWTWAATHDRLPAAICGRASASVLQRQVYRHDPSAGDPWGT